MGDYIYIRDYIDNEIADKLIENYFPKNCYHITYKELGDLEIKIAGERGPGCYKTIMEIIYIKNVMVRHDVDELYY